MNSCKVVMGVGEVVIGWSAWGCIYGWRWRGAMLKRRCDTPSSSLRARREARTTKLEGEVTEKPCTIISCKVKWNHIIWIFWWIYAVSNSSEDAHVRYFSQMDTRPLLRRVYVGGAASSRHPALILSSHSSECNGPTPAENLACVVSPHCHYISFGAQAICRSQWQYRYEQPKLHKIRKGLTMNSSLASTGSLPWYPLLYDIAA